MTQEIPGKNTYQLSGVDNHQRGFTRQVEISIHQGLFHAVLQYEKLKMTCEPCVDEETSLRQLVQRLQDLGYTQLRTQLIFQGTHYLGNQEIWVDYPDQESSSGGKSKFLYWIRQWFSLSRSKGDE